MNPNNQEWHERQPPSNNLPFINSNDINRNSSSSSSPTRVQMWVPSQSQRFQSDISFPVNGESYSPDSNYYSRHQPSRLLSANSGDPLLSRETLSKRFLRQILFGCSDPNPCPNPYCATNSEFIPRTQQEAVMLSLTLSNYGTAFACFDPLEPDVDDSVKSKEKIKKSVHQLTNPTPIYPKLRFMQEMQKDSLPNLQLSVFSSLLEKAKETNNFTDLIREISCTFSSPKKLGTSFTQVEEKYKYSCPVDFVQVDEFYRLIMQECPREVMDSLMRAVSALFDHILFGLEVVRNPNVGCILIVIENPQLLDPLNNSEVIPKLCKVMSSFPEDTAQILGNYFSASRPICSNDSATDETIMNIPNYFQKYTTFFQQFITFRLIMKPAGMGSPNKDDSVINATKCLDILWKANEFKKLIDFREFYNDAVNELLEIKEDFPHYKAGEGFSFCLYPFILNPLKKSEILRVESMVQMRHELQDSFFRALFIGVNSPYLILEIRREHIIRDALYQLESKTTQDLKKQLKVQFVGEEGVDEGGVQKEFFQLVVREMFDASYGKCVLTGMTMVFPQLFTGVVGMFTLNEDSRLFWFSTAQLDPEEQDPLVYDEYRLIGRLLGLAIYNSVILDIQFPLALYKKLMNDISQTEQLSQNRDKSSILSLEDLEELDPMLGKGMKTLLEFEPKEDVEEIFDRNFEVEMEYFGIKKPIEIVPGGKDIKLTHENREAFVTAIIDFYLNQAIHKQYTAFKEGFESVCKNTAIQLFRPEELELLICGGSYLDFDALERVTQYDGDYGRRTPVIQYFWEVVEDFTEDQRKRLLFFTTGSDRVPIGGLSKLQFTIAKNGPDSDRLPTSHTCFNVLLLPEYSSKERLKERLLTAIQNAEGFGMI